MLAANVPGRIALPFANGAAVGYKNPIPVASQIGITQGAASYTDGFPPVCFLPLVAGGIAPAGADFNGLLNAITAVQQWQSAGGLFHYDSAFSTAIGGYPAGAMIISTSNTTTWLNLSDNNTTNPDATDGSAANWAPVDAYGIAAITGLTNASVTLLPAQWSKPVIVLTGTLSANINIIFPTTSQEWLVVNNTTGAFVVTCKTSAGTGAPVAQGGGQQTFWGDGTNLNPLAGNSAVPLVVGTATAPTHALNQGAGDARYVALGSGGQIVGLGTGIKASATGSSATISISATEVTLESASNAYVTGRALSLSLNCAGTGANGLDTGALTASTAYFYWVIYNPTTTTFAALLSLSATAPTMPSGYTYKALLDGCFTDSTGNKFPLAFTKNGNETTYKVSASGSNVLQYPVAAQGAQGTIGNPMTFATISTVSMVPSIARKVKVLMQNSYAGGTFGQCALAPNPNIGGGSSGYFYLGVNSSTTTQSFVEIFLESTNIYYVGSAAGAAIQIIGWEI